jgi:hypothetical protein
MRGKPLDRALALFAAYVLSMQGLEALMWSDPKCTKGINEIASKVALIQNVGQPIVGGLLFYNFYTKSMQPYAVKIMAVYSLMLLGWVFANWQLFQQKGFFCTQPAGDRDLQWKWATGDHDWAFWATFVVAFLAPLFMVDNEAFALTIGGYAALSYAYSYYKYLDLKAVGSWWCVLATAMPYLGLALPAMTRLIQ